MKLSKALLFLNSQLSNGNGNQSLFDAVNQVNEAAIYRAMNIDFHQVWSGTQWVKLTHFVSYR